MRPSTLLALALAGYVGGVPLRVHTEYAATLQTISLDATEREVSCGDGPCKGEQIVILGERLKPDASPTLDLHNRVNMAVALYHKTGSTIIPSGGDAEGVGKPEADVMEPLLLSQKVPQHVIHKEDRSLNTVENAVNTLKMLESPTHIYLVTSEFHMPRSEFIFDQIMKAKNLNHVVTTHPAPSDKDALCDNLVDEINHFKDRWVLVSLQQNASLKLRPDARFGHAWDELKRMHARDC